MFLSIVFSFRNEEEVLEELIRRVRSVMNGIQNPRLSYELVFVNDSSTDNSLSILLAQAEKHQDIKVINMSRRFGVGPCVMAGLTYAKGDAVIYMDADLQDPPEVIPALLAAWQKGHVDVVHTVRKFRKGESTIKLAITKFGYFILNKYTNINLPVEAGDFKLLSRRAVEHLIQLKEHRPFMRGLVSWIGFNQIFIPYERDARYAGETKFPVFSRAVISNFFNSAFISFSSAPLMIASYLGLLTIFIDFLLVIHVFREKLLHRAIPGWTAIMIVILFFGGVQLFSLGVIGLYLRSVHEQVKNRPNFIVESTFGFDSASLPESKQPSIKENNRV